LISEDLKIVEPLGRVGTDLRNEIIILPINIGGFGNAKNQLSALISAPPIHESLLQSAKNMDILHVGGPALNSIRENNLTSGKDSAKSSGGGFHKRSSASRRRLSASKNIKD
jgi:hypothetical protein